MYDEFKTNKKSSFLLPSKIIVKPERTQRTISQKQSKATNKQTQTMGATTNNKLTESLISIDGCCGNYFGTYTLTQNENFT